MPKETTPRKKQDHLKLIKPAIYSAGNDATSFHGNAADRVIVIQPSREVQSGHPDYQ